jgi:hypothetical protein
VRNVEPITGEMNVGVVEPALALIRRKFDMTEQPKRHCCKLL